MGKEKELVKNTLVITIGKICTQFVSFLLLPLYTALLTADEYGTVDMVLTYSSLLLPMLTLAAEQALFRFLIDVRLLENDKNKIISTMLSFLVLQTVIFGFGFGVIYLFIRRGIVIYFASVLIATTWSGVALQLTRGLGDNVGYALGSMSVALSQVLFHILFLVVFQMKAEGMMLAAVLGNTIGAAYLFVRCRINRCFRLNRFDFSTFKEMMKYSLPLIPNLLSWWALNASDKVIVQIFLGVAANGLIAVATKFSTVFITFSNMFNITWTESAALHINDEDSEEFFGKTILTAYKLLLSLCCGIIVCLPFVFPVLVHSTYHEAYGLIPVFMIAALCNAVVSLYGVIYVAHKRTKEISCTAMSAAIINVVSHLVLIKFVGIYAAALSTMIGYGAMAVYRYFHSRKYLVVKFDRITVLETVVMVGVSAASYYCKNLLVGIVALFIVVCMCIVVNRNVIRNLAEWIGCTVRGLFRK